MKRPYVICHMLQSIDGSIAGDFFKEEETIKLAKVYSNISKSYDSDAIIYGKTTTMELFSLTNMQINSQEPCNLSDYIYKDNKKKWFVVIDSDGDIAWNESIYQNSRLIDRNVIVIVKENVSSQYLTLLKELKISYIFAGENEISLKKALDKLYQLFSIKTLLLQGGGITNTYFIKENLIDELSIVISPVVSGERHQPHLFENCHHYLGSNFVLKQSQIINKSGLYLKYIRQ